MRYPRGKFRTVRQSVIVGAPAAKVWALSKNAVMCGVCMCGPRKIWVAGGMFLLTN